MLALEQPPARLIGPEIDRDLGSSLWLIATDLTGAATGGPFAFLSRPQASFRGALA